MVKISKPNFKQVDPSFHQVQLLLKQNYIHYFFQETGHLALHRTPKYLRQKYGRCISNDYFTQVYIAECFEKHKQEIAKPDPYSTLRIMLIDEVALAPMHSLKKGYENEKFAFELPNYLGLSSSDIYELINCYYSHKQPIDWNELLPKQHVLKCQNKFIIKQYLKKIFIELIYQLQQCFNQYSSIIMMLSSETIVFFAQALLGEHKFAPKRKDIETAINTGFKNIKWPYTKQSAIILFKKILKIKDSTKITYQNCILNRFQQCAVFNYFLQQAQKLSQQNLKFAYGVLKKQRKNKKIKKNKIQNKLSFQEIQKIRNVIGINKDYQEFVQSMQKMRIKGYNLVKKQLVKSKFGIIVQNIQFLEHQVIDSQLSLRLCKVYLQQFYTNYDLDYITEIIRDQFYNNIDQKKLKSTQQHKIEGFHQQAKTQIKAALKQMANNKQISVEVINLH